MSRTPAAIVIALAVFGTVSCAKGNRSEPTITLNDSAAEPSAVVAAPPPAARIDGESGRARVAAVVAPPPFSGPYNEPPGMTPISQRSFKSLRESPGWDTDNTLSIVEDATAPISPPRVIRATYHAGFPAGSAPGHAGIAHKGYTTLYIRFAAKLSSNWVGNGAGVSKYIYEWTGGTNPAFFFGAHGVGSAPLIPYVYLQGIPRFPAGGGNQRPNLVPSARIIRGRWQVYEIVLTGNSAGAGNGMIDWWLDGAHVGHVSGIQWTKAATVFDVFEFRPIWGGVESVPAITQSQTMDWDHVYLSGKK